MMHQERYQATIAIAQQKLDVDLILHCNSERLYGALVDVNGHETPLTLGHVFGDKVAFRGTLRLTDTVSGQPVDVPFHCYASRSPRGISGLLKSPGRSLSIVGTRETDIEPAVTAPAA